MRSECVLDVAQRKHRFRKAYQKKAKEAGAGNTVAAPAPAITDAAPAAPSHTTEQVTAKPSICERTASRCSSNSDGSLALVVNAEAPAENNVPMAAASTSSTSGSSTPSSLTAKEEEEFLLEQIRRVNKRSASSSSSSGSSEDDGDDSGSRLEIAEEDGSAKLRKDSNDDLTSLPLLKRLKMRYHQQAEEEEPEPVPQEELAKVEEESGSNDKWTSTDDLAWTPPPPQWPPVVGLESMMTRSAPGERWVLVPMRVSEMRGTIAHMFEGGSGGLVYP